MTSRRLVLKTLVCAPGAVLAKSSPILTNFRFGVIQEAAAETFEFVDLTTRIPRRYKDSGFRWGIGFDNPTCEWLEWYELIHLPVDLREVSGNFQRTRARTMRTRTSKSNRPSIVDDFWFDEGDPLGQHKIELFVNGKVRYAMDFVVVEAQ